MAKSKRRRVYQMQGSLLDGYSITQFMAEEDGEHRWKTGKGLYRTRKATDSYDKTDVARAIIKTVEHDLKLAHHWVQTHKERLNKAMTAYHAIILPASDSLTPRS